MRYSATATSFPLSLPYPESLIPPNGTSAADELPVFCTQVQLSRYIVPAVSNRTYHANHTCFQILQHPPHSVYILGKRMASQPHARPIRPPHRLLLRLKLIQPRHWRKRLLATHEHVAFHTRQNRRLHEVPALLPATPLPRPQNHLRALLHRILRLRLCLVQPPWRRQRTHSRPFLVAM